MLIVAGGCSFKDERRVDLIRRLFNQLGSGRSDLKVYW